MLTMMKFDLVPSTEVRVDNSEYCPPVTVCPYGCPDVVIPYEGAETTLVGYFGIDTNHWTQYCKCPKCERTFVHEWVFSKQSEWYCDKRHGTVLLGIPVCCESAYKYPCECGGIASNTNKNGTVTFFNGKRNPEKDTKQCDKCLIVTDIREY